MGVESAALDEARRETERHRGVVSPLAGEEVERSAADHVGQGLEGSAGTKLNSCTDGVSSGESEETAPEAIARVHDAAPTHWIPRPATWRNRSASCPV